ncbi:peptidase, partial [Turicibacter sanguinis]|nr:peptidase [Turicibacter sanguinis]
MYIDLFIIQNLIYDYLILTGVAILTDEEFQYSRLLVGLSVGLLLSTFLFTIDITFLIGLVPFVMIWIVFKKQPVKKYGTKVLYFYCLSMILSGSIYSIAHFIKFEMTII